MLEIQLDMIQSIGLAIILLLIGRRLRTNMYVLEKYCIPSPVIGGLIFAILAFILKQLNIVSFNFDKTLQTFFMTMFFTSIGFNASLKVLKKGGIKVIIFLLVATGLIILQNLTAILLAKPLGIDTMIALMTGSTAMTGGHGTSASVATTLLSGDKGLSVAIAAATFGLVSGSIIGGPIARNLIKRYDLLKNYKNEDNFETVSHDESFFEQKESILNGEKFARAFFLILLSMAFGTGFNYLFKVLGVSTLPYYLGPMIVAAIIRNVTDLGDKFIQSPIEEIKIVENISLNLFLSMALMSLKLWDLIDLAVPVAILLIAQVIVTAIYARFVTFNIMGADYDAAVIVAGHCGFGLGATPNGITNMETVCTKYEYSKIAFFTVPLVGALFIDFVNISIISMFASYIK